MDPPHFPPRWLPLPISLLAAPGLLDSLPMENPGLSPPGLSPLIALALFGLLFSLLILNSTCMLMIFKFRSPAQTTPLKPRFKMSAQPPHPGV